MKEKLHAADVYPALGVPGGGGDDEIGQAIVCALIMERER